jgi:tRNA-dihydrouridine synthase
VDGNSAKQALKESSADGLMIGRGMRGRPWLLNLIATELWGCKKYEVRNSASLSELIAIHYEDILSFYGNDLGVRVARKHLSWYMENAGVVDKFRNLILTENCPKKVFCNLSAIFEDREAA